MPNLSNSVDLSKYCDNIENLVKDNAISTLIQEETKCDFKYLLCSNDFCTKFAELLNESKNDLTSEHKKIDELLNGNVDLIPNKYEGGFKVWEGLFDLVEYIKDNQLISYESSLFQKNKEIKILDLGCGSGILSVYIIQQIRKNLNPNVKYKIYLQDYNENVLKYFTIPNVILNEIGTKQGNEIKIDQSLLSKINESYVFIYGDWSEILTEFEQDSVQFDLIVTAETLYSEGNYEKLYWIFERCLLKPTGQTLIATKSHYFGVGGGTYSFLDYIDEQNEHQKNETNRNAQMNANIVHEIEVSLLRHIIKIKWNDDDRKP